MFKAKHRGVMPLEPIYRTHQEGQVSSESLVRRKSSGARCQLFRSLFFNMGCFVKVRVFAVYLFLIKTVWVVAVLP